jgi:hypothetical protein
MPLNRLTLPEALRPQRAARLDALAAYVAALPVPTQNHWEFLTCVLVDLGTLLSPARPLSQKATARQEE